jgi:cell volume regulation protein A
VARRRVHVTEDVLRVSDGLAWLAQAGMFLILGLFTDVKDLARVAPGALAIGAGLIVFARPVAVAVFLAPFRYSLREVAFIGWVGLRGAVPIVLALFPLMAGIADAALLFHLTFFTVLLSLLAQGASLPFAARLAQVVVPASSPILSAEAIEGSRDGRELVQLRVLPEARVAGRPLDELDLPGGARVVEIVRGGHSIAGTTLAAGDVVAVLARDETVGELEELFAPAPAIPEWSLDAATTLGDLRDYYGLEIPAGATAAQSVGDFLRAKLRGRPAIGDRVAVGRVVLAVRQAAGGTIRRVGLRVTPRDDAASR